MGRIVRLLVLVLSLAGCAEFSSLTQQEMKWRLMDTYAIYSCPQLHDKYVQLRNERDIERENRQKINAVNSVIGVLGGMITGNGSIAYYNESGYDRERRQEIDIIEQVAIQKGCVGVDFR
ncbi:exported hypothetical protein [Alphaproteobacteria bacterium]